MASTFVFSPENSRKKNLFFTTWTRTTYDDEARSFRSRETFKNFCAEKIKRRILIYWIEKQDKVWVRNDKVCQQNTSFYRPPSPEIWLNVPSISLSHRLSRAYYFYGASTHSVTVKNKKTFPPHPAWHHRHRHKNRITTLRLSANIIGSYRDEESPMATTGHNSINVFTQFNSPSAFGSIDWREECVKSSRRFASSIDEFFPLRWVRGFISSWTSKSLRQLFRLRHSTHLVSTINCP